MGYSGVLLACLDDLNPWLSHVIYHTTVWSRLASATTPSVALDLPRSTTSGLCRPKARTKFEHTYRPIAHMWGSLDCPSWFHLAAFCALHSVSAYRTLRLRLSVVLYGSTLVVVKSVLTLKKKK